MRFLAALALLAGFAFAQELPRSGTIGDLPPAARTYDVTVFEDGTIRMGERELDLAGLRATLRAGRRDTVVLRCDRRLPWRAMQWVLTVCAEARHVRIFHAVRPEQGDEVGGLALFLPEDRGIQPIPQEPPNRIRVKAHVVGADETLDPDALYARLVALVKQAPPNTDIQLELKATAHAPYGYCVRVCDLALRAGIERIDFFGTAIPPRNADLKDLVKRARAGKLGGYAVEPKPGVAIRFDGTVLAQDERGARPPVPKRVRGGFAGQTRYPDDWGEEIEEEEIEEPEPEIPEEEIVEEPIETEEIEDGGMEPEEDIGGEDGLSDPGPVRAPDARTRNAVELGLAWLAAHQDADGRWDCDGFMRHDPADDRCDGAGGKFHDVGVTGLATLAFLGAGYTDRGNKHARTVRNALRHLMTVQDEQGCIGSRVNMHFIYDHAIATLALCEAYWKTRNPRYKKPAQEALNYLALHRNPFGAWRYEPRGGDNDTSVTVWCLAALQSGKFAGLDFDPDAVVGGREWLEKMTDPGTGKAGYNMRGGDSSRPVEAVKKFPPEATLASTAGAMCGRLLAGETATNPALRKGAALIAALPPRWDEASGRIDMYYWLFGSIALDKVGGEAWTRWRAGLADTLQQQRNDGAARGSWDPRGAWGGDGGRIYATAMMTLCAELCGHYTGVYRVR